VTPPHDPQLLKGVLTLLLLQLLAERESYGYEVVQRLHEAGLVGVLEGTVYPALARLEREALLDSHLVASPSGPARKYYRLTTAGQQALVVGIESWTDLTHIVTAALERAVVPRSPAPPHTSAGGRYVE
jgi:PadR family transcriptional regulator PadR